MSLSLAVSGSDSPAWKEELEKHDHTSKPAVGNVQNTHYAETVVGSDVDHLSSGSQLDDLSDQKEEMTSSLTSHKLEELNKNSVESDDDEDYTEIDTRTTYKYRFQPKSKNPFDVLLAHEDTSSDDDSEAEWSETELENYTLKNRVRELEQKQYMAEKFLAGQATLNGIVYREVEENIKFRDAHAEKIKLENEAPLGVIFMPWQIMYNKFFALNPKRVFSKGLLYSLIESFLVYYICSWVLLGPIGESYAFMHGCFAVLRGSFVGGALINYLYNAYLFYKYGLDGFVLRAQAFTTRVYTSVRDYYNHYRRVTAVWEHVKTWSKYVAPVAGVSVVVGATYYVYKNKSGSNAEKKDQNKYVSRASVKQSILAVLVGLLSLVVYWDFSLLRSTRSGMDFLRNFYLLSSFFKNDKDNSCVNAGISCTREHKGQDRCQDCVFDSLERIYKKVVFKTDPTFIVTHIPQAARVLAQTLCSSGDTKWFDELPEILKTKVLAFIGLTYEDYLGGNYSICIDEDGQVYLRMINRKFFMRSATPSPCAIRDTLRFIDNQPVRMTRESAANAENSRRFLMKQSLDIFDSKDEDNQVYDPIVGSMARMEQMADESATPTREQLSEFSIIGERLQTCFESEDRQFKYLLVTNVSNRWIWLKSKITGIPIIGKRLDYIFALGVLMAIFLVVYLNIDNIKTLVAKIKLMVYGEEEEDCEIAVCGEENEKQTESKQQDDEFKKKFSAARDRKHAGLGTYDKADKTRVRHNPDQPKDRVEKIRTHDEDVDLPKVNSNFVVYDDPVKILNKLKGIPMRAKDGTVKTVKSIEEFNRLKNNGSVLVLDRLPIEYVKAHIEVSRPDVWADFDRFKTRLKDVLRKKEGWEKIILNQSEKSDLYELISSGDIKPDSDAKKAIQFLLGFAKKNEAKIDVPIEIKKELSVETSKILTKSQRKKEEVNVPCPAELVPGRPQCKVKGCTFVHSSIKKNEAHPCPLIKKDECGYFTMSGGKHYPKNPSAKCATEWDFKSACPATEQEIEAFKKLSPMFKKDEAKVEGKPVLKVSGNNAFAIVYEPDFLTADNLGKEDYAPGVWSLDGRIQFDYSDEGTNEISKLRLTGTACWVKKHFVTAAHVFQENLGKRLWLFNHSKRTLTSIDNIRSMIDRDIAIFTVDTETMSECFANFSRHRAVVADHNSGRKGVTLVKVDHTTKLPYCESGSVKNRNDKLGELSYDVMTQYGDSGCIVYDSENGTVLGIHKGIDVKGSTNKCHTFRNEDVVILHTQKPSEKSLN